jgi:hypothetical protein
MLTKGILTILLLTVSNCFMTLAWYGHLYSRKISEMKTGLIWIVLISWIIALLEYSFMIPANRMGFKDNGGPFSLFQLRIIQEAVSITVFVVFAVWVFKSEALRMNHLIGFGLMIAAVYFIFRK